MNITKFAYLPSKPLTLDLKVTLALFCNFRSFFGVCMNPVPKMNRTEVVDLNFFYNFYPLLFSVGRVSIIASLCEKEVQS
jgi:hypothetical protein